MYVLRPRGSTSSVDRGGGLRPRPRRPRTALHGTARHCTRRAHGCWRATDLPWLPRYASDSDATAYTIYESLPTEERLQPRSLCRDVSLSHVQPVLSLFHRHQLSYTMYARVSAQVPSTGTAQQSRVAGAVLALAPSRPVRSARRATQQHQRHQQQQPSAPRACSLVARAAPGERPCSARGREITQAGAWRPGAARPHGLLCTNKSAFPRLNTTPRLQRRCLGSQALVNGRTLAAHHTRHTARRTTCDPSVSGDPLALALPHARQTRRGRLGRRALASRWWMRSCEPSARAFPALALHWGDARPRRCPYHRARIDAEAELCAPQAAWRTTRSAAGCVARSRRARARSLLPRMRRPPQLFRTHPPGTNRRLNPAQEPAPRAAARQHAHQVSRRGAGAPSLASELAACVLRTRSAPRGTCRQRLSPGPLTRHTNTPTYTYTHTNTHANTPRPPGRRST